MGPLPTPVWVESQHRSTAKDAQDVRVMRGMGRDISDHHVVPWEVRFLGTWIKRREVVDRAMRIISEKLREHHYREEYARSLEGKRVKWDGENNVEDMWEQVKRAMEKFKRSVRLSESRRWEPKKCVVEQSGKSCG